ncbi:MAG TPA: hypothetical protein VEQ58_15490, partial [Polyangiaceae bacterium]|nr:hypothetical protein [Polyangiaceae bacterium]
NLLSLLFTIALLELCAAKDSRRLRSGLLLGFIAGMALLVKVSNLVLLGVIGAVGLLEFVQRQEPSFLQRTKRLGPWIAAGSLALCMTAPQYWYNQREYGKVFLDGWYRRPTAATIQVAAHKKELLDRRTLGYVFGFSTDIVTFPYMPMAVEPSSRFWSVLIATSYSDYFNYRFGPAPDKAGSIRVQLNTVARRSIFWGGASVASGIGIALVTVLGWVVMAWRAVERRSVARQAALLVPALGAVGAIYFATQYPYDFEGVVKAHYFHFVAFPLYAVYGASVAWLLRHRLLAPLGWLGVALLIFPAAYCALSVVK